MGYSTSYDLKWKPVGEYKGKPRCEHSKPPQANYCPVCGTPSDAIDLDERVGAYIEASGEMSYVLTPEGESNDSGKWYEHEADMRKMSEEIKQVLFTLHGEGEESGDIWTAYFLNGKMQKEKAQIQIAGFDKKKLT